MTEKSGSFDSATLISKLAKIFKAIPNDKMEDITDVIDLWNEPGGEHKNPGRGEIVTGPAQRMSGDGLPKMIGEYSSPAPQQGLAQQYAEFDRMLADWAKSLTDKFNPVLSKHEKTLNSLVGIFSEMHKAQTAAPTAPAADTFLGKALLKLAKAKSELRKADLADEDEKEEKKSHIAAASDLLKSAKRLLAKASEEMEEPGAEKEEETEKAMSSLRALSKAVAKAEEEEKEWEETEKAKAVAAQKAIDDAAAATKKAEEEKEKEEKEAAEKAKAVVTTEQQNLLQLQEAVKGNAVLMTTVQTLVDAVMGKSVNPVIPEISKGVVAPALEVDFMARAEAARDAGQLTDQGDLKVASILQHMSIAKAGHMDMRVVEDEIAKSSSEVRAIFQAAA